MVTFLKIITMAMRIGNFLVVDYAHGDDTVDQNIHEDEDEGDSGRLLGVREGEGAGNAPKPSRATLTSS